VFEKDNFSTYCLRIGFGNFNEEICLR